MQRRQKPVLAIDRMRRRQQRPERLAAKHILARRGGHLVGRVRLAGLKFRELEGGRETLDVGFEPRTQRGFVQRRLAHPCFLYSCLAIARRWTSSGPSARRKVRTDAQAPASGKSADTPPPPCAWIASSSTFSAVRGAATLIIAISPCAALLPTRSIMSAALRHSSRVISISIRASAIRSSQTDCSDRRLPNAV